jgi:DNA-binding GntR family transcriptional regulator
LHDRQTSDFRFGLGEPIVINEIADHLRVSATPVRESLIRLKCEGFLDGTIRHGFVTKVLTVK